MIGVDGMDGKFIYVFSVDDKNNMVAAGYRLLRADEKRQMYVFENTNTLKFSNGVFKYVVSDILTF